VVARLRIGLLGVAVGLRWWSAQVRPCLRRWVSVSIGTELWRGRADYSDSPPGSLDEVIASGALRSVFQPIVDLDSMQAVAYEALVRGPAGSVFESPAVLFDAARCQGRITELDWACRIVALEGALDAGLHEETGLFVNVEPQTLGLPPPERYAEVERRAAGRLRIVLEITERSLTARPADILDAVAAARQRGWGIALDDVGADPRSLALLPFVAPDVVKLDIRLVQGPPDAAMAETMTAVAAHAERFGASVLAEGVETEAHLARARALGARLGQGFFFGRPSALPPVTDGAGLRGHAHSGQLQVGGATPFETVVAELPVRRSAKGLMVEMSKHLETQAARLSSPGIVLAAFQDAGHFTRSSARRYQALASRCSLVAALGVGLGTEPAPGVRGADLVPDDPLVDEWSIAVVGAHYAAALVARDLGDRGPEASRRFDYALTHDRSLAIAAAASLMRRVLPTSLPDMDR